ncbi:MAG: Tat pathway signal protein [Proteobacteria bacterium]|nr:Tat pathway signal protein [Pseudomonadota bacterium]MBW3618351.1 Tat pathway signal protein [Pseudomonadota bacterium]
MRRTATLILLAAFLAGSPAYASEKKKGGGLSYLQLKPLAATVLRPDGRRGILTVEAGIDTKDEALYANAQASMPRLRAALVTVVQNHAQGLGPGSAPSADRLLVDLQRATDRVLGRSGGRVLLGTLMIN